MTREAFCLQGRHFASQQYEPKNLEACYSVFSKAKSITNTVGLSARLAVV